MPSLSHVPATAMTLRHTSPPAKRRRQNIATVPTPPSTTHAAFKDYRPTGCRVVFDVASRKPKGCGYLSFENARDMLDAIRGMNKRYFEDRYLVVKEADPSRPPAAARANGWDGSGRPKGSPPPPLSARSSGGRSPPLPSVGPDHGDSSRSRQHSLWPPERPVSGGDRAYVGCISGGPPPGFGPYSSSNRRDMTPPRRGSEGYGRHDRYRPYGSPPRNGGGRFPDSPPRRRDGSRRPDWPRRRDSSRDRRPDSPRGGGGSGRLYGDRAGYTDGQGDGYPRGGMVQDGLAAASASGSWRPPGSSPNGALPRGVWIKPEPGTAQGHVGALLPPTGRLLGAGGGHGTGAADGSDEPAASLAPQGEKGEEADPQRASMSPDICAPTPTGAAAPPPEALLPAAAAPPSAPSLPYKAWAKRLGASGGGGGGASLLDDGVGDAAAHTADALPPPATGIPGLTLDKLLFKSMLPGSFKSSDKGSRITIPTPYRKTLVAEFTALRIVPSLGVSVQVNTLLIHQHTTQI